MARQAAPVTPLEAKEAYIDALHRHGGYQDEINEVFKYEELKGVDLSHQGAHQLIQYELSWRTNRDAAMEADKDEAEADVRNVRGRQQEKDRKGRRAHSAPIDCSKVPQDACLYCGNKGHRTKDCRIEKTDIANGTPGKRQTQRPTRPSGDGRENAGGGKGDTRNNGGGRNTSGGGDRDPSGGRRNTGAGADKKTGGGKGRASAFAKADEEAQARLDKGLCVSCGATGHKFADCPKLVTGKAQHRHTKGQENPATNEQSPPLSESAP